MVFDLQCSKVAEFCTFSLNFSKQNIIFENRSPAINADYGGQILFCHARPNFGVFLDPL